MAAARCLRRSGRFRLRSSSLDHHESSTHVRNSRLFSLVDTHPSSLFPPPLFVAGIVERLPIDMFVLLPRPVPSRTRWSRGLRGTIRVSRSENSSVLVGAPNEPEIRSQPRVRTVDTGRN